MHSLKKFSAKSFSYFIWVIFLVFISCANTDKYIYGIKDKVLVIYIIADNNLNIQANAFINSLSDTTIENNCEVIIYIDDNSSPRLYKIKNGLCLIRQYEEHNSTSPKNINSILSYIAQRYPAKETGLILWSHGTGWLYTENSEKCSFGIDKGCTVNISELATSLPIFYNYIIFDACYMSSLEVLTELKDNTQYLLASPTIVPNEGIITKEAIPTLLKNNAIGVRLRKIADTYINNYALYTDDISITLTTTSLIDNLIRSIQSEPNINKSNYNFNTIPYYNFRDQKIFFDAVEAFKALNLPNNLLTNTIKYYRDNSNGNLKHNGVSIFVPHNSNYDYFESYNKTKWNQLTLWLQKFQPITVR